MPETLFMRRRGEHLRAVDAAGADTLAKLPTDAIVRVDIRRPRNVRHHRKYWALLQAVFPHQDVYPTMDSFAAAMKAAVGLAEPIRLPDGRIVLYTGSISFASMDQATFDQFYERVVQVILTRILPGVSNAELERQVVDILQGEVA
jgi:hypothetical protein